MTFSVCATVDGRHGVAVATKAVGVGSTAPFVSRYGAVCTQATTNTPIGVRAIRALEEGIAVDDAVSRLLEDDDHRDRRQVHGVDAAGNAITETGADCVEWAGDLASTTDGYTVAGNMLVGAVVLEAMADAFVSSAGRPLDERLLGALRAGEDAGGDKRRPNAQSGALAVFDSDEPRLAHDLRVDEHDDAVGELERLHELATDVGSEWETEYPRANLQRHPER